MFAGNSFGTDEHNAHTQPDGAYHYHGDPKDVQKLDSVEHIDKLQLIGRKVVEKKIRPEHFAGFINN